MKRITVLFLILIIAIAIFPQRKIWMQNDWTGGPGQNLMSDSTMFWTTLGVDATAPMMLTFLNDTNWTKLNTFPPRNTSMVNKIIEHNDTIYAATGFDGFVTWSRDMGNAWTLMDTMPVLQGEHAIYAMIMVNDILYAGGFYGGVNKGVIYRSYDRHTWDTTTVQPSNVVDRVYAIEHMSGNEFIAVAGNPDITYAMMDGIILKSYDACSTWTKFDSVGFAICADIKKVNDSVAVVIADSYVYGGVLYITYDGGETWAPMSNPFAWEIATAMHIDSSGTIYIGDWAGQMAYTSLTDTTWTALDTSDVIPDVSMVTGIDFVDTVMYVTCAFPGTLYKSYDYGMTFEVSQDIASDQIVSFTKIADHTYAVAASDSLDGGRIYTTSYWKTGIMESSVFALDGFYDPLTTDTAYTTPTSIYWWGNAPRFTSATLKVRTGNMPDMSDADDWSTLGNIGAMGSEITIDSSTAGINVDDMYMQYYVQFTTSKVELTPYIDSILVEGHYLGIEDEAPANMHDIEFSRINTSVLRITNPNSIDMDISIFDISGRNILNDVLKPGMNRLNVNIPQGKYIIKYNNKTDNILILK